MAIRRSNHRSVTSAVLLTALSVGLAQLVSVVTAPSASAEALYVHDDFESGTTQLWLERGGDWDVAPGGQDPHDKVYRQQEVEPGEIAKAIRVNGSWRDYNFAAEVTPDSAQGAVGLIARYEDERNYYAAELYGDRVELSKTIDGQRTVLASAPYDRGDAATVLLEVELRSDFIKVYIDHHLVVSDSDDSLRAGKAGLGTWGAAASFDDVRVTDIVEVGAMRANLNWYERFFVSSFQRNLNRWNEIRGDWERLPLEIQNGQGGTNQVVEGIAADDGQDPLAVAAWQTAVRADSTTRVTVIPTDGLNGAGYASVLFRMTDRWNHYAVNINSTNVTLERKVKNTSEVIAQAPTTAEIEAGEPLYVEIDAYGSDVDVYLNHDLALSASDTTFTEGRIGLSSHDTVVRFDDIETNDKHDQFALLDEIKDSGIDRVRLTYTRERYLRAASDWIKHANEIDLDVLLSFSFTGDPQYYPPGTEKVFGAINWGAYRLSDLYPDLYAAAYSKFLRHMKDEGAKLDAVGLGNEVNWYGFNGDLREVPAPRIFDMDTDIADPEFARVREGIENYGQLIQETREITDAVYESDADDVEIVSGGLNHPHEDGINAAGRTAVRPALFLALLAGSHPDQPVHARDYLSMVDQIGVHLYPFQNNGMSYDVNPETSYASTLHFVTTIMDPLVGAVGTDQPFMIAEAGSYRRDAITKQGELITEQQRLDLYRLFLRALQDPRLDGVDFSTIQMYSFDDGPWAAYEDGELLPVGEIFAEYPY